MSDISYYSFKELPKYDSVISIVAVSVVSVCIISYFVYLALI